jgi:hypothetical protein
MPDKRNPEQFLQHKQKRDSETEEDLVKYETTM